MMKIKPWALTLACSGVALGAWAGTDSPSAAPDADWSTALPEMLMTGSLTLRECTLLAMLNPDPPLPPECEDGGTTPEPAAGDGSHAVDWMRLYVYRVQADRLSPPVASRLFAYTGVTLYEAVRHGAPGWHGLAGQLNGLETLPGPQPGADYDWPLVAAAAMARLGRTLFAGASPATLEAIDDLYLNHHVQRHAIAGVGDQVVEDSGALGRAIADAVIAWAAEDGFEETRDLPYTVPECASCWVPTGGATNTQPLEPYWGTLRPFVLTTPDECPAPAPVAYSEDPGSGFYAEALTVYEVSRALTPEQRLIAHFWADTPGISGTPPGHWIALIHDLVADVSLVRAAEAYALTAIAMADSFIVGWHEKYVHNLLRPETYIQRHIDSDWQPEIPTPPFPEFVSGHSTSSGAAAEILTALFGDGPQVSSVHRGRGFAPRHMESFRQGRDEVAVSRLYGGIHFEMGNDAGLFCGICVGEAVVERVLTQP